MVTIPGEKLLKDGENTDIIMPWDIFTETLCTEHSFRVSGGIYVFKDSWLQFCKGNSVTGSWPDSVISVMRPLGVGTGL